jgi:hypothetical protein
VIVELIIVAMMAGSRNAEFDDAYATAMKLCVALAPENASELGDIVPGEVAFWFRSARLKASTTFWNDAGRKWLSEQPPEALDSNEEACARQLVREAEQEAEVETVYPPSLDVSHQ